MSTAWLVILGAIVVWVVAQNIWIASQLLGSNVQRSLRVRVNHVPPGRLAEQHEECERYTRISKIEDGIEWINYLPKERKHETPILMQHGM